MLRSFKIGEYIFNRIKTITGYDCYPCIADNDVKFPYIVYNRNGLSTSLTKDGYCSDNISFEISIYSDKYAQSISVAESVRDALEILSTNYDKYFEINNSVITNTSEYWDSNAYVQNIVWSADIVRYIEHKLIPSIDEYNEEVFWRGSSRVNSETLANGSITSIPAVQIGKSIDMFNYPYVNGVTCLVIDNYLETTVDVPVFTYNDEIVNPTDITYSIGNKSVVGVNNERTKFIITTNGGSTTITASYNGSSVDIPFTATKNSYAGTYTVAVDPADVTFSYGIDVPTYFTISGDQNNIVTANNYYSYGDERHYSSNYTYTIRDKQFNGSKYFGNLTLSCTSREMPSNTWINDLDTTTFSYNTYSSTDTLKAYYDGTPAYVAYNIPHSETTSIDSILTPITITDDNGEHKYVGVTAYGGTNPSGNVDAFWTKSLSFTRPKYIIKIYSTRAYLDSLDTSIIARFGTYAEVRKNSQRWTTDTQVEGYDVCYTYSSTSNFSWAIYANRFTEENKVLVLFSLGMNTPKQ